MKALLANGMTCVAVLLLLAAVALDGGDVDDLIDAIGGV